MLQSFHNFLSDYIMHMAHYIISSIACTMFYCGFRPCTVIPNLYFLKMAISCLPFWENELGTGLQNTVPSHDINHHCHAKLHVTGQVIESSASSNVQCALCNHLCHLKFSLKFLRYVVKIRCDVVLMCCAATSVCCWLLPGKALRYFPCWASPCQCYRRSRRICRMWNGLKWVHWKKHQ